MFIMQAEEENKMYLPTLPPLPAPHSPIVESVAEDAEYLMTLESISSDIRRLPIKQENKKQ